MAIAFEPPGRSFPSWRGGLCLLALLAGACQSSERPSAPAARASKAPSPDRLTNREQLPESEVAFGLSLPPGLKLTRQFNDSAYFLGRVELTDVLLHVKDRVTAGTVQMIGTRSVFPRTKLRDDESGRLLRIEVSRELNGTQVFIQDITPPPTPKGLSEAEMWTRAGRNPDGTPRDENQQY